MRDLNCKSLAADQFPDTGSTYDNTMYICFDYKFSSDSFFVYDEFDTELLLYKDFRPGYAGFKMVWDYGMTGYPMARYTYLIFAHKGPNPNHKVTVRAWYNDGECGGMSYNESIGTFYSSCEWKLDTILIPEHIRSKNDIERNQSQYYQLLFLINNLDSDTTSGAPGCLKIDDIKLAGYNPIDTSPQSQMVRIGKPATLKVVLSKDVSSLETISYQWKKNGIAIPDAKNPVYTITTVAPQDSGRYTVDVHVASSGMTFTSWGASLTISQSTSVLPRVKDENPSAAITNEPDTKQCGCGSGAGLALLPPLWFRIRSLRKKKYY
jgi:hypothetical protein